MLMAANANSASSNNFAATKCDGGTNNNNNNTSASTAAAATNNNSVATAAALYAAGGGGGDVEQQLLAQLYAVQQQQQQKSDLLLGGGGGATGADLKLFEQSLLNGGGAEQQQQQTTNEQQLQQLQQMLLLEEGAAGGGNEQQQQQQHRLQQQQQQLQHQQNQAQLMQMMDEIGTNLIINYIPQTMTQDEVRAMFSTLGEVESCKLIRDKTTGQSLGYAFVNYVRLEDARRAQQSFNGLRLQNKTLKVSYARPSHEQMKGANLYVSGFPKTLTQPELESIFRPFGGIVTSRILFDNATGLSKGVGFVRFDRKQEAEVAIEKLNGTKPFGGDEFLTVKFANNPATNPLAQAKSGVAAAVAGTTALQMAAAQQAAALLPLQQLLQGASLGQLLMNGAVSGAPLLNTLPVGGQVAGGGPIRATSAAQTAANHHRLRYSPLATATNSIALSGTSAPTSLNPALLQAFGAQQMNNAQTASGCGLLGQPQGVDYGQQQQQSTAAALLQLQQQLALQQQQQQASSLSAGGHQQHQQQQQQLAAAYAAALSGYGYDAQAAASMTNVLPSSSVSPVGSGGGGGSVELFVHGLGSDAEESVLWRLFGPFGAVLSVKIVKEHGGSGKCRGYGFVTMANHDDAVTAVGSLNGYKLGSRSIQVAFKSQQQALMSIRCAQMRQ